MEAELAKASNWNSQVVGPFHKCDLMLSKYTEQVSLLGDRWKRINGQIDTRYVLLSYSYLFYTMDLWTVEVLTICYIKGAKTVHR